MMTAESVISWLKEHATGNAHLCLDSRQIEHGDVFFACPGIASDGRLYIDQAIGRGAAAIVVHGAADSMPAAALSVPVLSVEQLSSLLGAIADEWYGRPSRTMSVVAVTGTNGKTSTVQWLAAALNADGVHCGTIGTLGVTLPDGTNLAAPLTTPDVVSLHRSLALIRDAGATVVALEASSIGIAQGRLDGVHIDMAGFTNLTRDHLDYHHTLENYKAAKFALFAWPSLRAAIVNGDDPAGAELLASLPSIKTIAFSLGHDDSADIQARDIHAGAHGLIFNLTTPDGAAQIVTRLVGEHNVSNLLLVAGVLRQFGWGLTRIARVLSTLLSVQGRLQVIEPHVCGEAPAGSPLVVVDYAHTPDALERALTALLAVARSRGGRLICVVGCGGSRDRGKRPIMGAIADRLADDLILTNDNPRTESPQAIIDAIRAGMERTPVIELNRATAILTAVWGASPRDVVLLAGKGHETYQEFGDHRIAFDDREWARFALTWQRGVTVSTDSRTVCAGQIFIALEGDAFDGHDYLDQVRVAGACAAIVAQHRPGMPLHQFELGDTRAALTTIATAWRRQFDLPMIGVTGSNGKTTTKEMIASILRVWLGAEAVLATEGNLNNDLGVPLTLLRLNSGHRAAVVELGMNHPGEIARLTDSARPTVALVNNAQREHQEFMHTVVAVARENGAVLQGLPETGIAVFPGDDPYNGLWQGLAGDRKTVRFGLGCDLDVSAADIRAEDGLAVCRLHTPLGSSALMLSVPGVHNVRNAMAAAACAYAAGAPLPAIVQGLEGFRPVAGRLQAYVLPDGMQLIDDTYNANPDSVRAAIDVLAQLHGRKVLVLGDMAEVGGDSAALHAEVGTYARECGIDGLMSFGSAAAGAVRAFGEQGGAFDSIEALVGHLATLAPAHILVKGSRSARMERVVHAFEKKIIKEGKGARHAT